MTTTSNLQPSYLSRGLALALIAGAAVLSGCGPTPAPVSQTTTTTEETTTRPMPPLLPPATSSTTTTRFQQQ